MGNALMFSQNINLFVVLRNLDLILFVLVVAIYYFMWRNKTPNIDLNIFVESIKTGLTAASILLSLIVLLANKVLAQTPISSMTIYIALVWAGLSILAGIWNLFTLPTIVGNMEVDPGDRIVLNERAQLFIALLQLLSIVLISVRIITGAVL